MQIRLVVFDLAGTTVRDGGEVVTAFTRALEEHGVAVTPAELAAVRGSSKREAILRFVRNGPDRQERGHLAYRSFRRHLETLYSAGGVAPVPGAEQTFRELRGRGIRVALNTGFDRDITTRLLSALGWSDRIVDTVVCGDDVKEGRPAPDLIFAAMQRSGIDAPAQVANVGDTTLDLLAGWRVGVAINIGVTSGAHTRAQLEAAPHTHVVESVGDVPSVLTRSLVR
ncbi:MAG TPA: phosphonatase-like hydrolase [Vicinamibacterales bacterium]|nr:phosphonatase-like hydrolase [Vicinamibacterales bacterium]